jgi:hypothetical protein
MARIKIVDLPADVKISPEEMKKVFGGAPRKVTMYANPFDIASQLGIIDPIDPRGINIPPVTSDPSALRGINIPPAAGERCAETWGGT